MVDFAAGFTELGSVHVGPVPLPVIITAVHYALCQLLLNRTRIGVLLLGPIFVILNFERGQGTFQLNSFWRNLIRGHSCW